MIFQGHLDDTKVVTNPTEDTRRYPRIPQRMPEKMPQGTSDRYLLKRGPKFYLKITPPTDVLHINPTLKPVIKSLRTSDIEVARRLRDKMAPAYLKQWDALRLAAAGIEATRGSNAGTVGTYGGSSIYGDDDEAAQRWLELDVRLEELRLTYERNGYTTEEADNLILATPEGQAIKASFKDLRSPERLIDRYMVAMRDTMRVSTQRSYRTALTRALTELPTPMKVTPEVAKAYFRGLSEGHSSSTLRQAKASLRGLWGWLEEEGVPVDVAVWDRVKTRGSNQAIVREPIPIEVLRGAYRFLLKEAETKQTARITLDAFVVALHTGARLSEVLFSEYDLGAGLMHVRASKTEAGVRTVPIHDHLLQASPTDTDGSYGSYGSYGLHLKRPTDTDGPYHHHLKRLIETQAGARGGLRDAHAGHVSGFWSRTVRASVVTERFPEGIPKTMTFHSIRHTVITALREADVPIDRVKSIVGHKDRDVTFGLYGRKVDPEVLRGHVNKLRWDLL